MDVPNYFENPIANDLGVGLSCEHCGDIGRFFGGATDSDMLHLKNKVIRTAHTLDHLLEYIQVLEERIDELELDR